MSFKDLSISKKHQHNLSLESLKECDDGSFNIVEEYTRDQLLRPTRSLSRNLSFSYANSNNSKMTSPMYPNDDIYKNHSQAPSPRSSICRSSIAQNNNFYSDRYHVNDQSNININMNLPSKNDLNSFEQDQMQYTMMKWFSTDKDEMELVCDVKDARINYLMQCNDHLKEELRRLKADKLEAMETIAMLQKEVSEKEEKENWKGKMANLFHLKPSKKIKKNGNGNGKLSRKSTLNSAPVDRSQSCFFSRPERSYFSFSNRV